MWFLGLVLLFSPFTVIADESSEAKYLEKARFLSWCCKTVCENATGAPDGLPENFLEARSEEFEYEAEQRINCFFLWGIPVQLTEKLFCEVCRVTVATPIRDSFEVPEEEIKLQELNSSSMESSDFDLGVPKARQRRGASRKMAGRRKFRRRLETRRGWGSIAKAIKDVPSVMDDVEKIASKTSKIGKKDSSKAKCF